MKLYFTFTKKSLGVILVSIIIVLILLGQFFTASAGGTDGSTNAKRIEYLSRLGLKVNETASDIKDVTVPQNFSSVYKNYNSLQKKAGFNLENYKGKSVKVYTYECLDNSETAVHIMVYDGKIIGGDIADTRIDGEMTPLKKENE